MRSGVRLSAIRFRFSRMIWVGHPGISLMLLRIHDLEVEEHQLQPGEDPIEHGHGAKPLVSSAAWISRGCMPPAPLPKNQAEPTVHHRRR
jgi:hypothetical protein